MIGNAFSIAALTLVGLAFVQALAHKLRDLRRFTQNVRDYDLLPVTLPGPASLFLVMAELSTVFLILIAFLFPDAQDGLIARFGLVGAALLLTLYGLGMAINLARKRFGLDCGCTSGGTPISAGLVVRHPALQEPRLAHLAGFKQSRTTPIHSVSGIHRKRLTPGKMRDHTVPADGCQVGEHLSEAVVRPAGDRSFAPGLGLVGREGRQRVAFGDGLDIFGYISRFPGSRNAPSSIPKDKNNACSIGIVA